MFSYAKLGRSFIFPTVTGMFGPLITLVPIPEFGDSTKPQVLEKKSLDRQQTDDCCLPVSMLSTHLDCNLEGSRKLFLPLPGTPCTSNGTNVSKSAPLFKTSNSKLAPVKTLNEEFLKVTTEEVDVELELVDEGVGGTYFFKIKNAKNAKGNKKWAIFKPADEEPGAKNNPKGYSEEDHEKGDIKAGEGWKREVLAYKLDHYRFANVPETIDVKLPNRLFEKKDLEKGCKVGSLQRFVQSSDGTSCKASCDMGPGAFPTDEVHRIGQLDIRLLNCDRHGGNALVQKDARGSLHLIPIDHSYILPRHAADLDFEWLFWPQSKEPFSAETAAYIAALQPESDAALMKKHGIDDECIELMRAATMALQEGCGRGLSLRTIGRFMRRERMYDLSEFEKAVLEARKPLEQGGEIEFHNLQKLLKERLGALSELPLAKPIKVRPVTLKEEVLVSGVTAEPLSSDPEGTYFIKTSDGICIAVFKSLAPRKGRMQLRGNNLVSREIAAHRLDDQHWAGVPETVEMRIPNDFFPQWAQHRNALFKRGCLQKFVPGSAQPLCEVPSWSLPVKDVHKVGILDIRLCNTDRHCRSLLFVRNGDGTSNLIPISHAGILPSSLDDIRFPWCRWPQAKVPFSDEELDYIQHIDPETDARVLQDLGIGPESIELHVAATMTLKKAAILQFTLQEIGLLFERSTLTGPSCIEALIAEVRAPLDEGGLIDFDLLERIMADRLRSFKEQLLGNGESDELTCCCICMSTGALTTRGSDVDDMDGADTCISFTESDSSGFAWDGGTVGELEAPP